MPFVRNSLDIIICSDNPDIPLKMDNMNRLIQDWVEKGWLENNQPVSNGICIVQGGFVQLIIEKPEKIRLYANHQGGYRVRCPKNEQNIAREFSRSVQDWRAGGDRILVCPSCSQIHALEEVTLLPSGAFSQGAICFKGAESISLTQQAQKDIDFFVGRNRVILKRLS